MLLNVGYFLIVLCKDYSHIQFITIITKVGIGHQPKNINEKETTGLC